MQGWGSWRLLSTWINLLEQTAFRLVVDAVTTHASRLLGHSTEEMTKKVYRRVGEMVNPTK